MWNKLFKKREKVPKPGNSAKINSKLEPKPTTNCFSFRKKYPSDGITPCKSGNFKYLKYQSQIYGQEFDENEYPQMYQNDQHPEDDQQLNEIFIEIPPSSQQLEPCPVCERKFRPETLIKHAAICEKVKTKRRNVFDSSLQRWDGKEPPIVRQPTFENQFSRVSPPKQLSRKSSEISLQSQPYSSSDRRYMLDGMRRHHSGFLNSPKPTMKRSMSQQTQQSEKCPQCERMFGYKAFDRHVEWCKERALIKPSPDLPTVSAAKNRMMARINYKAPNLKTKRGNTREKYSSNSCGGSTHSLLDIDGHIMQSMSSSMTSDSGLYDPFISAKKQLEELLSPSQPPKKSPMPSMTQSMILTTPIQYPKTPQPVPKMSNFKRTSSLRVSNRKTSKPLYSPTPVVKSTIQRGFPDDSPVSPNFVKIEDFDELPIKSPYSAIKLCENALAASTPTKSAQSPQPSKNIQAMPVLINNKPLMRDKISNPPNRNNLKLDLKNLNLPSDYPISKTDSLALFLKYEKDLSSAPKLTEKDLKDKSNSLSKRAYSVNDHQKLPDINGKQSVTKSAPIVATKIPTLSERPLITLDKLNQSPPVSHLDSLISKYSSPKYMDVCDNPPTYKTPEKTPEKPGKKEDEDTISLKSTSSKKSLRRQIKLSKDNIMFDTTPDSEQKPPLSHHSSESTPSNHGELRNSNPESVFDDFDFDEFINTFHDDPKFPIFQDYKNNMSGRSKSDEENNNTVNSAGKISPERFNQFELENKPLVNGNVKLSPKIQQVHRNTPEEISGLEKLDNLCKLLTNPSDSDESTGNENDASEQQTTRSKSSADSAYGSLSRQSPMDYRRNGSSNSFYKGAPRQCLELKTTEIYLTPIRSTPTFSESPSDQMSKFCHECGYKFIVPTAKFCIECGVRRVKI